MYRGKTTSTCNYTDYIIYSGTMLQEQQQYLLRDNPQKNIGSTLAIMPDSRTMFTSDVNNCQVKKKILKCETLTPFLLLFQGRNIAPLFHFTVPAKVKRKNRGTFHL